MINPEVFVFLIMVLCGMAVSLIFDLFRAIRIVLKPNGIVVAVSDVIFCAIATLLAVGCVWNFNDGIFRFYEVAGLGLGGIFYFLLLSPWILKLFLLIVKNILRFTQLIFKILLTPSRFLYKILVVPIRIYVINIRQGSRGTHAKRIQKQNNKLHKGAQKGN